MGEIIQFPIWINPFPVLKINFKLLGENEKHFVKEVFFLYQRPGRRRNNSISFLDKSISYFKNQFGTPW